MFNTDFPRPLSALEVECLERRRQEAFDKDLKTRVMISEGYCVHELGSSSKDCKFCQNIMRK
jgi:hypothetical protein